MKRILFLLIIISLAPGCLILPLPADHREAIDKVESQIAVGRSTREDVISILGEPDVTTDRYIFYQNKEYDGEWFWLIIIPSEGDAGVGRQVYMNLYFEFDNFGVLTEICVIKMDRPDIIIKDAEMGRRSVCYFNKETAEKSDTDENYDCNSGMESCD